jgi:hypothetical protein
MLQQSHLLRNQPECRKRRLFRFFHSILEHYSFHPNIYTLLLIIEILQISNYGLHSSYGPLWNDAFSNGIRYVLSYTDLSPMWQQSSPVSIFVFNAICMFKLIKLSSSTRYLWDSPSTKLRKILKNFKNQIYSLLNL